MRHDGRTSVQYVEERRITISYHTQLNDQYILLQRSPIQCEQKWGQVAM